MMKPAATTVGAALLASLMIPGLSTGADNKITPVLTAVEVMHNGQKVTISRGHDLHATIPEAFQKTDRGCPPFCVQPMRLAPGVETVGEIEVLGYLKRAGEGDKSVLVVDSRTPDWVMRGTIPGSVNIPWTKINTDTAGTFGTPAEAATIDQILSEQFGAAKGASGWDFSKAKTLVLFCNGIWCPQSSINIETLVKLGYPADKIKWYRGGMQDWFSVGLTTVKP
jgi:rhodanese-related sulfurtransferase